MTDESNEFESTNPFGPRPEAPTPAGTSPFAPMPPSAAGQAPGEAGARSGLRRAAPVAAFVIMVVLVAAAAGAVAGHEVWTSTQPQAVAPPAANGGSVSPPPGKCSNGNSGANPFPGLLRRERQRCQLDEQHQRRPYPTRLRSRRKVDPAVVDVNSAVRVPGQRRRGHGNHPELER